MDYDLIIIGGGPAGVTAGIYAARKRMKSLLITKDFLGQISETSEIDNYPGFTKATGLELMQKFEQHLKSFEIEVLEGDKVKRIEKQGEGFLVETEKDKKFSSQTVIVATGRDPRPLEVPGEKEFIGHGVSYCSICDAPFFKDKIVAVIGGGNSGFEAALDLAKYARKIYIFERTNKIIADEILQEQVKKQEKIEVQTQKKIIAIKGNGKAETLAYQDVETGRNFEVPINGVFIQIGSIPATAFVKDLVKFNERDEIEVEFETCQSSTPGLFAAGDVNNGKWKQVIIACGEGARAALAAYNYIQSKNQ